MGSISCSTDLLIGNFSAFTLVPDGVSKLREMLLELSYSGQLTECTERTEWHPRSVAELAALVQPGAACGKQHQVEDGYVHLRTHNVATDGKLNFDTIIRVNPAKIDRKKASLKRGDIIFNNTNSQELVGKTCLVDQDYNYAFSNHLTLIRTIETVDPAFIVGYFGVLLRRGYFAELCNRWIGQAGINTKTLREIEVPLPPLPEQRRIVAKVDSLMSMCDELEAQQQREADLRQRASRASLHALTAATDRSELQSAWRRLNDHFETLYDTPETIDDLRQTILYLAVQGKLVEQEQDDEASLVAIQRVADERRRNHARNGGRGRWSFGPLDEKELPFRVPTGWTWCRISDVAERVTVGHVGSMKDEYVEDGIPFLRTLNVRENRFESSGIKYITAEFHGKLSKSALAPGDVVVVRSGNVGTTCVVPETLPVANCSDLVIVKRPLAVAPEYLSIYMNSAARAHIAAGSVGVALTHFNTKSVAAMPLPLPPVPEQKRIVERVNSMLTVSQELETQLGLCVATTERLLTAMVHRLLGGD